MRSNDRFLPKCVLSRKNIYIKLLICVAVILCTNVVFAADVYMSTTGTKTTGKSISGDWSNNNCYNNLQAAIAATSTGDTITIEDGIYSGTTNSISNTTGILPPSGAGTGVGDARFTIIRAKNIPTDSVLKVYLPEGLRVSGTGLGAASWVKFWGIQFDDVHTYSGWDHLYFKQCAFMGTLNSADGDTQALALWGDFNLVEDSVAYGKGRYKFSFYDQTRTGVRGNHVCRRCVARNDFAIQETNNPQPISTFVSYWSRGTAFLNSIDVDSDSPMYWKSAPTELAGSFYQPVDAGSHNMIVQGSIVLNSALGFSFTEGIGDIFIDNSGIRLGGGHYMKEGGTTNRLNLIDVGVDNFIYRSQTQIDNNIPSYYAISGYNLYQNISNSVLRDVATKGADTLRVTNGSYLDTYLLHNDIGATPTNSMTVDPYTNGLLYPTRIEAGSTLATAGSGGGQMGARILNKLGKDGTFKGDADWNTEQGALWPWPLEAWVKAQMASMPATITGDAMPSPTRGFASATAKRLDGVNPVTLTSYIWESLGSPIPAEIYNTVADTIAPTVTAFTIPAFSSTLSVSITTFTATDNIAVTAYMITETASAPAGSDAGWLVSPPASFTFVSSGSKSLYAWAKDAAGHVSASRSANVVVTVTDTMAPTVTALATPSSSTSLLVPNIGLMASDNVGVTGYMLNETAATPTSTASGWVPAPPTSYTFATAGTKTLYARAKDAAGNISSAVSAAVLVDLSQPAGNTYYLDPAGVDTNPCSQALPCRQLAKVLPLVVAGDTILLADGTYAGADVTVTGTSQSPISIKAPGKNAVISARANVRGNLYLNNCAYVVVDGIKTSGGTGSLAAGIAVRFSDHVTVKNSTTFNNYVWGIFVSNSPNIILENNESYGQTTQHGIYVADATASHDQPVIRGNKLHDNAMNGLHMNGDNGGTGYFTGAVIENNTIYNNTLTGINMDGVQSSFIRNNLLYNNHGSGIAMYQTDAVTGPAGNQVLNNTIDMASNSKWAIRHTGSVGVSSFRNNIFYNRNLAHGGISTNSATDVINTDSDYNIFAGSNYAATPDDEEIYLTLAQWQTAGKDVHSFTAAPAALFMNVGVDYHLAAASPAIDKGQTLALAATDMDGNARPNGLAFDIGSFEVVKVSDSIAPDVTSFSMPATATSLTVAVSIFSATDAVGVTAYLITESSTKPAVTAAGWTAAAPVSFSFASAGSRTAYAWARDAAGNVSLSRSATVVIDMAAPVVSAFSMPATATSLAVAVTSFTASDSAGVTGYLITETASVPSAAAAGWTLTAPTSFTFSSAGSKTAYAWARDPAGNVSSSRSAVVAIDTAAPAVSMLVRKNNASISGTLSVTATASDNVAVSRVEFYVNETLVATLTAAPYVYNWDSTTGVSGANALMVKAYDAAGNMGQSNTVKMIRPSCQVR